MDLGRESTDAGKCAVGALTVVMLAGLAFGAGGAICRAIVLLSPARVGWYNLIPAAMTIAAATGTSQAARQRCNDSCHEGREIAGA